MLCYNYFVIKEIFLGKPLSNFSINPLVKAFIISETFLWTAWNSVAPIFAIFAATKVKNSNTEIAASIFSVYLIARVVFELVSGRYIQNATETKKFVVTIIGIGIISASYIGLMFTVNIENLYLFSFITGVGFGIASPPKNSLFSTHLDKNRESVEWGVYDAITLIGMAFSALAGGFIANRYGFTLLFSIAAVLNLLAIIPYLLYIKHQEAQQNLLSKVMPKVSSQ